MGRGDGEENGGGGGSEGTMTMLRRSDRCGGARLWMEAGGGAVGWEGCGGKDPATGERQVINREAVEPHQVGGPCRRCTVATSQHHLATSEMSRSSKKAHLFQRLACDC